MWMMGYNDGHDLNMPDSFNGRKLRPLMPRPVSSTNNPSTTTPPCLGRIHGTDFFTLNHHIGSHFVDQNKREFNTAPVVVSSRWNPTPEQLRTLEELYRCGTRTPSADQIQHITAQLRRYGKIEGKNVFYWFQNHKARERQKRRRQMESTPDHHEHVHEVEIMERKDTGGNRTGYEVEQTKNWATSTNCSTLAEESRAAKVALAERRQSSGGSGGWIQFDEEELQHRRLSFTERNATWQMVQLSCPSPTHLINTTCTTTNITTRTNPSTAAKAPSPTPPPATALTTIMDQKQLIKAMTTHDHHHHHLNIFIPPSCSKDNVVNNEILDDGCGESHHTLQLFPLRSGDGIQNNLDKATDVSVTDIDANLTPYQFFEFLPLKN